MTILNTLKNSILEELVGAENEYKLGRYKNALILYSKAIFSMCDLLIAIKNLRLPKDHNERFRVLERYLPAVYKIVDKVFKKYTDTYLKPTDKESCEGMKNAIKEINSIERFDKEIKTFIEKI
ncbi:MAG: hypothetical protein AB1571_00940 [Nanoarchaeota archaeon]